MNGFAKAMPVVVLSAAMMVAGCSGASKTPVRNTTPSASSTDVLAATRAAVLAAYTGMWSDYESDALTSNWQNPVSANHATGQALLVLDNTLAVNGHHGWIVKGTPTLHPVVKDFNPVANPTSAEIVDCDDLSHFLKYVAMTGALQDSTPGGWHLVDAGLVLKDGRWMVSRLAMGTVGSC